MSKAKTRHESNSALVEYLGVGKELVPSEVPTLRAALQLALHLQDERWRIEDINKRNYPVKELMRDVIISVFAQWERANVLFKPPILCASRYMERRLENEWETAKLAARGRLKANLKAELEQRLDKLLDPLKCFCQPIQKCTDVGCLGRKQKPPCLGGGHLTCSCPKESKIPKLELLFVKSQRAKVGESGGMQIASVDFKEDTRQKKAAARKESVTSTADNTENKRKAVGKELEDRVIEENNVSELVDGGGVEELGAEAVLLPTQTRNYMDISSTAQTSLRYEMSVRSSAAVISAFLGDLIKAGEISPSKAYLAVDQAKLQRARDQVLADAADRGDAVTEEDTIHNVMFDSRLDATKERRFDEQTGRFYARTVIQDHYTLTDGDGRFLVHITKPAKEQVTHQEESAGDEDSYDEENNLLDDEIEETDDERDMRDRLEEITGARDRKPAEVVAQLIYDWLKVHGVDDTLQFLSADSTNSNTGWRAGIIAWLEKMLGRKVVWCICQLHTNELGLRHLFEELDGKTNSKTGWSGPLGKLLKSVQGMLRNYNFKKVSNGPELIELPPEVVKDLSTDQSLLYQLAKAVRSGHLPREVALRKPGSVVHSRWLTFAQTLLFMWMSEHGLSGHLLEVLETIVTYLVSCYIPMWFEIKVKSSWLDGPRHVLTHLGMLKRQSPRVQKILMPYLRTSSWFAHSEAILQTMLCSDDMRERKFAVDKIVKIRGRKPLGRTAPRARKLPKLNAQAKSLQTIISWDRAHEPLHTCHLSKDELRAFITKPMEVPYISGHTQPIERAVKEVTAASAAVYGEERRDGWVRSRAESRATMPKLNSKKDLLVLVPGQGSE